MTLPDATPPLPIVVNASATQTQLEALLRSVVAALALIAAAFGLAKYAGVLNIAAALAGPLATVITGAIGIGAIVWGQIVTRRNAKKAVVMAAALPDSIAVTK